MAACAWREGEPVTFSVSGEPEGEGPAEAWRVSCSFRLRGEEHQMATYRRLGPRSRHLGSGAGPGVPSAPGNGGDKMRTVGPGLYEPCDVKRVGSDNYGQLWAEIKAVLNFRSSSLRVQWLCSAIKT